MALTRRDYDDVAVPDGTLRVATAGEGPLVVFCHGFPGLSYSWRNQHRQPAIRTPPARRAPAERTVGERVDQAARQVQLVLPGALRRLDAHDGRRAAARRRPVTSDAGRGAGRGTSAGRIRRRAGRVDDAVRRKRAA